MISPEILESLSQIEQDLTVPKNIRSKVKAAMDALQQEKELTLDLRVNKALQELDDLSDNPNIPVYTRTQIWNVVSQLESIK
ncbi:MAG: UPF0147 family protein [Candidatus Woesearchaeota archaeon]